MSKIKKLLICSLLATFPIFSAIALDTPPPPSLSDVSSGDTCSKYMKNMEDFLTNRDGDQDDLNAAWFEMAARITTMGGTYTDKKNNDCMQYVATKSTVCYMAEHAPETAKSELLNNLNNSYQQALENKALPATYYSLGLKGSCDICSNAGPKLSGCSLFQE